MNPPAGIDMSLIREALQRRQAGGGGTPAAQQVSIPQGGSPLQAPVQPVQAGQLMPQQQSQPMPQAQPQQAQPSAGGQGGGQSGSPAQFDDETKAVSKALIARLMKVL